MSFLASLENELIDDEGFLYYFGSIKGERLDDYFRASATFWNRDQYYESWLASFDDRARLNRFVMITSMYDPYKANFIEGWVFYVEGNSVFLQNHIFLLENYKKKNLFDFNSMPGSRETVDEDGEKLSEWLLTLHEVEVFFDAIRQGEF